jgi:serine/threonine protein kinase
MASRVVNEVAVHASLGARAASPSSPSPLRGGGHPNIVGLLDFFEDDQNVYLVLEAAGSGDLYRFLQRSGPLPPPAAAHLGRQLLAALAYLHAGAGSPEDGPVMHRDLKLSNLLLHMEKGAARRGRGGADEAGAARPSSAAPASRDVFSLTLRLCDFGLAVRLPPRRPVRGAASGCAAAPHGGSGGDFAADDEDGEGEEEGEHRTVCGTPAYIAPEVAARRPQGVAADVYSAGCLLYSMLFGRPPLQKVAGAADAGAGGAAAINNVAAAPAAETASSPGVSTGRMYRTELVADYDANLGQLASAGHPDAADLIRRLMGPTPDDRPSAAEALAHPFFARSGAAAADGRTRAPASAPVPASALPAPAAEATPRPAAVSSRPLHTLLAPVTPLPRPAVPVAGPVAQPAGARARGMRPIRAVPGLLAADSSSDALSGSAAALALGRLAPSPIQTSPLRPSAAAVQHERVSGRRGTTPTRIGAEAELLASARRSSVAQAAQGGVFVTGGPETPAGGDVVECVSRAERSAASIGASTSSATTASVLVPFPSSLHLPAGFPPLAYDISAVVVPRIITPTFATASDDDSSGDEGIGRKAQAADPRTATAAPLPPAPAPAARVPPNPSSPPPRLLSDAPPSVAPPSPALAASHPSAPPSPSPELLPVFLTPPRRGEVRAGTRAGNDDGGLGCGGDGGDALLHLLSTAPSPPVPPATPKRPAYRRASAPAGLDAPAATPLAFLHASAPAPAAEPSPHPSPAWDPDWPASRPEPPSRPPSAPLDPFLAAQREMDERDKQQRAGRRQRLAEEAASAALRAVERAEAAAVVDGIRSGADAGAAEVLAALGNAAGPGAQTRRSRRRSGSRSRVLRVGGSGLGGSGEASILSSGAGAGAAAGSGSGSGARGSGMYEESTLRAVETTEFVGHETPGVRRDDGSTWRQRNDAGVGGGEEGYSGTAAALSTHTVHQSAEECVAAASARPAEADRRRKQMTTMSTSKRSVGPVRADHRALPPGSPERTPGPHDADAPSSPPPLPRIGGASTVLSAGSSAAAGWWRGEDGGASVAALSYATAASSSVAGRSARRSAQPLPRIDTRRLAPVTVRCRTPAGVTVRVLADGDVVVDGPLVLSSGSRHSLPAGARAALRLPSGVQVAAAAGDAQAPPALVRIRSTSAASGAAVLASDLPADASLPRPYRRLYRVAAAVVGLLRARTPKVAVLSADCAACLMEDGPAATFEFRAGARVGGGGGGGGTAASTAGAGYWRLQYRLSDGRMVVTSPSGASFGCHVPPPGDAGRGQEREGEQQHPPLSSSSSLRVVSNASELPTHVLCLYSLAMRALGRCVALENELLAGAPVQAPAPASVPPTTAWAPPPAREESPSFATSTSSFFSSASQGGAGAAARARERREREAAAAAAGIAPAAESWGGGRHATAPMMTTPTAALAAAASAALDVSVSSAYSRGTSRSSVLEDPLVRAAVEGGRAGREEKAAATTTSELFPVVVREAGRWVDDATLRVLATAEEAAAAAAASPAAWRRGAPAPPPLPPALLPPRAPAPVSAAARKLAVVGIRPAADGLAVAFSDGTVLRIGNDGSADVVRGGEGDGEGEGEGVTGARSAVTTSSSACLAPEVRRRLDLARERMWEAAGSGLVAVA